MSLARPLPGTGRSGSLDQSQMTMTEDEVMRIRTRYNKALRAGMSNAEASAYANGPGLGGALCSQRRWCSGRIGCRAVGR